MFADLASFFVGRFSAVCMFYKLKTTHKNMHTALNLPTKKLAKSANKATSFYTVVYTHTITSTLTMMLTITANGMTIAPSPRPKTARLAKAEAERERAEREATGTGEEATGRPLSVTGFHARAMSEDDGEFESNKKRERRERREREAFLAVVYTALADGRGRLSIKNRLAGRPSSSSPTPPHQGIDNEPERAMRRDPQPL